MIDPHEDLVEGETMTSRMSLSPGEVVGAIALAFALFLSGFVIRGWSEENPLAGASLVIPTAYSYDCTVDGHSHIGMAR